MPYQGTSAPSRAETTISLSGAPIAGLRAAADLLAQVPVMPSAYVTVSKGLDGRPDMVGVQLGEGDLADRIAAVMWLAGVLDDAPHAEWNGKPHKNTHYFEVNGTFAGVKVNAYAVVPVRELLRGLKGQPK